MLLHLPLLQATLRSCSENWAAMPTIATGRYCARCEHTVHDFSQAADPAAAVAAARAASPTGRVCGRFAVAQVARPQLSGRLRRFVVALVLVFGLGLPAHEALAQVRRAKGQPAAQDAKVPYGMVAERMPEYRNGGREGLEQFLQQNLKYPAGASKAGRVYLYVLVNEVGQVKNVRIAKGLEPLLDAEALRVVRLLGPWEPGTQAGRPVAVSFSLPITFKPAETKPGRPAPTRLRRPASTRTSSQLVEGPAPEPFLMGGIDGPEITSSQEVAPAPQDTVLTYAEQMPALPGGTHDELRKYIQRQARWPANSGLLDVTGRVFVQFVVGRSGRVRDVQVVKGLESTLDVEAVRVVQALGRLQPGRQQGWPVAIRMVVAISFNRE